MENSYVNCEAYSSIIGVSSDHRTVKAKIRQVYAKIREIVITLRYDWSLFTIYDIRNQYTETVRNKFNTLQEISERQPLNDKYENFVTAHIEAAADYIPTKPRTTYGVSKEVMIIRQRQDYIKKHRYLIKRKPTNMNVQKLKKDQK